MRLRRVVGLAPAFADGLSGDPLTVMLCFGSTQCACISSDLFGLLSAIFVSSSTFPISSVDVWTAEHHLQRQFRTAYATLHNLHIRNLRRANCSRSSFGVETTVRT